MYATALKNLGVIVRISGSLRTNNVKSRIVRSMIGLDQVVLVYVLRSCYPAAEAAAVRRSILNASTTIPFLGFCGVVVDFDVSKCSREGIFHVPQIDTFFWLKCYLVIRKMNVAIFKLKLVF